MSDATAAPSHIIFWSRGKAPFSVLSNFASQPLRIGRRVFACPEAYFHHAKFLAAAAAPCNAADEVRRERLVTHANRLSGSGVAPLQAKRMGGKGRMGLLLVPDELAAWDAVRFETQSRICTERLQQPGHEDVRRALFESGSAVLVHFERGATPASYWGGKVVVAQQSGRERVVGQNTLGQIWMVQRRQLSAAGAATTSGAGVAKRVRTEHVESV